MAKRTARLARRGGMGEDFATKEQVDFLINFGVRLPKGTTADIALMLIAFHLGLGPDSDELDIIEEMGRWRVECEAMLERSPKELN